MLYLSKKTKFLQYLMKKKRNLTYKITTTLDLETKQRFERLAHRHGYYPEEYLKQVIIDQIACNMQDELKDDFDSRLMNLTNKKEESVDHKNSIKFSTGDDIPF